MTGKRYLVNVYLTLKNRLVTQHGYRCLDPFIVSTVNSDNPRICCASITVLYAYRFMLRFHR